MLPTSFLSYFDLYIKVLCTFEFIWGKCQERFKTRKFNNRFSQRFFSIYLTKIDRTCWGGDQPWSLGFRENFDQTFFKLFPFPKSNQDKIKLKLILELLEANIQINIQTKAGCQSMIFLSFVLWQVKLFFCQEDLLSKLDGQTFNIRY